MTEREKTVGEAIANGWHGVSYCCQSGRHWQRLEWAEIERLGIGRDTMIMTLVNLLRCDRCDRHPETVSLYKPWGNVRQGAFDREAG